MRVPFSDIRAEYMNLPDRRVIDMRRAGLLEIPVLGWCSYSRARPDLPVHRHWGAIEVHYLHRGHQVFDVRGKEFRLSGGDVFVTQPDEEHSTGGYPVGPCVLYWLLLRVPKPGRCLLHLPARESAAFLEMLQSLPARQFRGSPSTKHLFNCLFELHDQPATAMQATRLRTAMVQLLLEIVDCGNRREEPRSDSLKRVVAQMIESRPGAEFQIKSLARKAGLSLSWFKTKFKEETGLSPARFIVYRKIEAACDRLSSSDEPIGRIAGELGFPNSQYFATVFRRLKGVSPRAYRLQGAPRQPNRRPADGQF